MAEEKPTLHVDSDWKKQAQEEKKRLAEQEAQQRKTAAPAGVVASAATAAAGGAGAPETGRPRERGQREGRQAPVASFATLVQSMMTQVLFYLGDVGYRGSEPVVDLDMARYHLDTLGLIEEKTRGNLTPEEKQMLDAVLYEARMRFVSVATRQAELP